MDAEDPSKARAFEAKELFGYSVREIAAELGVSEPHVYQLIARAKAIGKKFHVCIYYRSEHKIKEFFVPHSRAVKQKEKELVPGQQAGKTFFTGLIIRVIYYRTRQI